MRSWNRFTVIEYSVPVSLSEKFVRDIDIPIDHLRDLLLRAGDRVRALLGLDHVPIFWSADRVQFQNFAGLLILAPRLELEVTPKFLGNVDGWREDFFLLASLSHHGRLIDDEDIKSSAQVNSDLATLIGRSLVEMYWRNQRRPLRTYRSFHDKEFAIEGDFDPEDLVSADEEGFLQQITSFTRTNTYNAVISAAASRLSSEVPDAETRARLERVTQHLPRQARPTRVKDQRLPNRSHAWQPTYDLSLDILRDLGGAYDPKNAIAPGFVLQTWRVWEHLIYLSLRRAFGVKNVALQSRHFLGIRQNRTVSQDLNVIPDVIISISEGNSTRRVLVDAKYQGHVERSYLTVSNADIYEVLAFSRATTIKEVILAYPRRVENEISEKNMAGYATEFSRIMVDDIRIRAIELGVCGISKRGGIRKFVNALARQIRDEI